MPSPLWTPARGPLTSAKRTASASSLASPIGSGGQHLDMPTAWDTRTGILEPLTLVVAGPAYTSDVFCKPSVEEKRLGLEITLLNPGAKAVTMQVENRVVPCSGGRSGKAEKTFSAQAVTIGGRGAKTIQMDETWTNPTLWWPDRPHLYWVVTTLKKDGKVIDIKHTEYLKHHRCSA